MARKRKRRPGLEIYRRNLMRANQLEADDRRKGISEKPDPLRSGFGNLPGKSHKARGIDKIVQGGLPGSGKRQ